ncbi:ABC transporter ATP-binding protein [Macrococcus capreoli]|uniref:ABC transporter ATP-binding protein n=1 Tax=Macrococcus capreoli TaxID=2982690 RepID=UPI0021D5AF01|nr:ABC transporter ATP-binding protein [Macrococcus sp. TMW 2.2395]MCU7556926.1 energy-coupling factor ABC transporter ATP-binding protein [Macrococcus sp. TMW 2.2395]
MLKVSNLRLKYPGEDDKIFDGLNLEIQDKEKVLLLGPSGSGKSTLLNVLSGIVPQLVELPMKYDTLQIHDDSSVIFQDPDSQFCMPKVYEELAFILENQNVPRAEMDGKIRAALTQVGLNVDEHQMINQLSGGMKQKLAIAGSLLQNANTLFLDEPTAMLDHETTQNLWSLMIELWQDQTVLIVEHKVSYIWEHVDRIILMNQSGEIVASDSPEVILKEHEQLLNDYGVWHPNAYQMAPEPLHYHPYKQVFKLALSQVEVKRKARVLYQIEHLEVKNHEWVAITGNNGAGKTTLFDTIMQIIPYNGEITFNGNVLKTVKDAAQHLYLVYQNPELQFIQSTVYDEIYFNYQFLDEATAETETIALLTTLQLYHLRHRHPYELSMGQKRRLSVATALSTKADIILLDEPTFGLDSKNTFELITLFKARVASGQSIIMVTHDEQLIMRYPSRVLNIQDGHLVEVRRSEHV